jgi:signal transduction histidine kinase
MSHRPRWHGRSRRSPAADVLDRLANELDRWARSALPDPGATRPGPALFGAGNPRDERGRKKRKRDLAPDEQALEQARKVANRKLGFIFHLVPYAMTCLFLLLVAGFRVAMIVALSWGIGIACHWFAVVAPTLRRQLVEREVNRQLDRTVSAERRSLGERHARTLEELSASIAHEIRNPITAAKSLVQQMGEDPSALENVDYARVALEELDRVERSVSHLLRYAREEEIEPAPMRMAEAIDAALESFRDRIERGGVRVRRQLDGEGAMQGDVEKIRRALINLVGNALDSLEQGAVPDPVLEIHSGENLAGNEVWVRVRDNGPGIDAERMARIFRPFYTSKANGTGLGLAITKKLVDAHGGSIEAHSSPGGGAEFLLVFPKHREGREPRA